MKKYNTILGLYVIAQSLGIGAVYYLFISPIENGISYPIPAILGICFVAGLWILITKPIKTNSSPELFKLDESSDEE